MSDPVIIPSGATALELVEKIILDGTPGLTAGTNLFMSYTTDTPDDAGLVYMVLEGPDMPADLTMGTIVALEHTRIDVIIYGAEGDYRTPKLEAMRIRYLIASKNEYTALGLRALTFIPVGNIEPLGRDPRERVHFMVKFHAITEPSFA